MKIKCIINITLLVVTFSFVNTAIAQDNDRYRINSISGELSIYKALIRGSLIYQRKVYQSDSEQKRFSIEAISGIGVGSNGDGIDRRLKEEYLTAGFIFGIRLFRRHYLETGVQFYYSRIKEGYLSITDHDKWMYQSYFRLAPGYRIDGNNVRFRIFVIPEFVGGEYFYGSCCPRSDRRRTEKKVDLYPSISFGVRL